MSRFAHSNDSKLPALVQLAEPTKILTLADLQDVDHVINNKSLSGKREGAAVMIGGTLYVAKGSTPSSPWEPLAGSGSGGGLEDKGIFDSTKGSLLSLAQGKYYATEAGTDSPPSDNVGVILVYDDIDSGNGKIVMLISPTAYWVNIKLASNTWSGWRNLESGSNSSSEILYAGDVTPSVDPMLEAWGSPAAYPALIYGTVTGEFINAPSSIPPGEYRGTIVKSIGANFIDLTYTTLSGRIYKKLKFIDGSVQTGDWEELGVSAKEAIWTLKNNTENTTVVTGTPSKFKANMSLFNAVESDFLGDLNTSAGSDFEFTVGQSGAFEVHIHGAIEDAANATQKIAVSLFDEATNDHMTGSMQILSPASAWGSTNEFTFNCTGFARLDPNNKISLQVMVDANATLKLNECIVILKPIEY